MVVGTRATAGVVLRLAGFIVGLTSAGELGDSWENDEGSWAWTPTLICVPKCILLWSLLTS